MDKYLLALLGSSVDEFYEADSWPILGDFTHARHVYTSAGGCPLNVGAVCASKGEKVKALDMLGKEDPSTDFLLKELKRLHVDTSHIQIRDSVSDGKVVIILNGDQRTMFVVDPIRPHYEVDEKMQELLNGSDRSSSDSETKRSQSHPRRYQQV